MPPVAPPMHHATGACLLGLNPGELDTEFRIRLRRSIPICILMQQVAGGAALRTLSVTSDEILILMTNAFSKNV